MAQLDIRHIVRDGLLFLGDRQHVARWHEEERGLLVDEAGNEPGTGNAIKAVLSRVTQFMDEILSVASPLGPRTVGLTQSSFEPLRKLDRVVIRPEVHV